MSDLSVSKIVPINIESLQKVLSSREITEAQKVQFINKNKSEIRELVRINISGNDFKYLMKHRPLIKFRPLKNSFTKRGDKIILAKVLNIDPSELDENIESVVSYLKETNDLAFLPDDKLDSIRTYIYRHGTKDQLTAFFDYELTHTKNIVESLYRNLEYHTGGLADYFIRPIHRLDNNTLIRLYNIIDRGLDNAQSAGNVNAKERAQISKWALIQIYKIQNNNKLKNAIKTYKVLSQT